jgi:hypothetical protein
MIGSMSFTGLILHLNILKKFRFKTLTIHTYGFCFVKNVTWICAPNIN